MMRHWDGHGWAGGHWVVAIVSMVLFWGVAAAVVVIVLVRTRARPRDGGSGFVGVIPAVSDAERILHERFARGEIDEEEYTRRHDLLKERTR